VARDIAPLPTTSISPPFTSSQYLEFPQATIRFASACLSSADCIRFSQRRQ
jgi:hypothetical protein